MRACVRVCTCTAARPAPGISNPQCVMARKPSIEVFVVGCFELCLPPRPICKGFLFVSVRYVQLRYVSQYSVYAKISGDDTRSLFHIVQIGSEAHPMHTADCRPPWQSDHEVKMTTSFPSCVKVNNWWRCSSTFHTL
jgi:hypothetical protein